MHIPLLSDINKTISKDYGCLIEDGQDAGISFRATYIIDKHGIVRHESVNDLPVGRNPDEFLRLVKAFQFSDEQGQVCPAYWQPGQKTMIPDPKKNNTRKLFRKQNDSIVLKNWINIYLKVKKYIKKNENIFWEHLIKIIINLNYKSNRNF